MYHSIGIIDCVLVNKITPVYTTKINFIMKNIKETLFEWRKNLMMTLFSALIFALPSIVVFLPYGSNYETYKWYIFGFIVASTIGHNILITRCENYEQTIKKMNDEIEKLKDDVESLKKEN